MRAAAARRRVASAVPETEAGFQQAVVDLAQLNGFLVAHFRPARMADGRWRTPVAADGAGFPDLVLVRERVVFAEIKLDRGLASARQEEWIERLAAAGAEVYLWRPRDWPEVQRVLGR